jgi:putative acetyltransferase
LELTGGYGDPEDDIIAPFKDTFRASGGEVEGDRIANLVIGMSDNVAQDNNFDFSAIDDSGLVGAVIFKRMNYAEDERRIFILSPAGLVG